MCPLAHPLLPESGATTAETRDEMCVPSSAEADQRATLSLILTGVTGFARRGVVGGTIAAVAPAPAGRATPATPVNI